ncbi:hypothetical protein N0Y54_30360 [Nostoc punctiforme UO1]|uniref:hypothetical protein n=1 Tax=Nostoc punctiforme TaxID=272131 RepID=UPI003098DD68
MSALLKAEALCWRVALGLKSLYVQPLQKCQDQSISRYPCPNRRQHQQCRRPQYYSRTACLNQEIP